MLEKIEKEFPFINIEIKDKLYYVYGYFGRLMFIATNEKEIYKNLREIFK